MIGENGKGRGTKLVFKGAVTDGLGRAAAQRGKKRAQIARQSVFLKCPFGSDRQGIKSLRECQRWNSSWFNNGRLAKQHEAGLRAMQ